MRALLLLVLSLITTPAFAQGFTQFAAAQPFNCVPQIIPGPLSQGLGFLWIPVGGLQFDFVHKVFGVNTGGASSQFGFNGVNTSVGAGGITFASDPPVITTDNGLGTGNFSLVIVAYAPISSSNSGYILNFGSVGNAIWVRANANSITPTQGNGEISINFYDGTNFFGYYTAASTLDFSVHSMIFTVNPTGANLYLDGISKALTPNIGFGTNSYSNMVPPAQAAVGSYYDGSTSLTNGLMFFAAEFNRTLTPGEILTLSSDPASKLLQCPR